jgi:hypothetical protein
VLAKAEVLEGLAEFVGIDEEIGKDDDKGALLDFFGNLVKSRDETSSAFGLEILERIKDGLKLGCASAGRNFEVELFVAAAQSGGIALVDDEIGKCGGDAAGEVDLGRMIGGGKVHGRRGIDDKVGSEISIGLELLDVVTVGAGVGFPVEAAGVIARDIFAVFRELDR